MIGHPNKRERNNYFIYIAVFSVCLYYLFTVGRKANHTNISSEQHILLNFSSKPPQNPRACNFKIGRTTQIPELKSLKTNLRVTSTTSSLRSMSSLLKTVLFLWKSLGKGLLIFWMTGLYIYYQRSEFMCGVSLVLNAWFRRYSMGGTFKFEDLHSY